MKGYAVRMNGKLTPIHVGPCPEIQQAKDFGLYEYYDNKAGTFCIPLETFKNDESVRDRVLNFLANGKVYKRDDVVTGWVVDKLHYYNMSVEDAGEGEWFVAIAENDYC